MQAHKTTPDGATAPVAKAARRPTGFATGLALGLILSLLGAGIAGCDKPCARFCKRMETCLSPKQKKRFFSSRAQCEKNCSAWHLEDAAKRCLDKAEGSCFRMMKCMGPAIQAGIRKRALQKQRLRRHRKH